VNINRHWQRLAQEETETTTVGSILFAGIVFGGATALVVLYLLQMKTSMSPGLCGAAAILSGLTIGGLAASFRWIRILAIASIALAVLVRLGLLFFAVVA